MDFCTRVVPLVIRTACRRVTGLRNFYLWCSFTHYKVPSRAKEQGQPVSVNLVISWPFSILFPRNKSNFNRTRTYSHIGNYFEAGEIRWLSGFRSLDVLPKSPLIPVSGQKKKKEKLRWLISLAVLIFLGKNSGLNLNILGIDPHF